MGFTKKTKEELDKLLSPDVVKKNPKGHDYIEGWHAEAEANRIFDFDGWSSETLELIENTPPTKNHRGNNVVSFRAKVRVTVGDVVREGIGFGSGISGDIHAAYEGAIKEAATDAEKRAFKTFGNPFGLALYDKLKENVGYDDANENTSQEPEQKQEPKQEPTGDEMKEAWIRKRKDKGPFLEGNDAKTMFSVLKLAISKADTEDDLTKWRADHALQISSLPNDMWADIVWLGNSKSNELKGVSNG